MSSTLERVLDHGAPAPATKSAPESSHSEHRAELWCCPISMEIMRDPVLAADGFTYERNAIADWLSRGNASQNPPAPPVLLPRVHDCRPL